MTMKKLVWVLLAGASLMSANRAVATPSTTFWTPATSYVQPYLVPHITYDTYFGKGPLPGALGAPSYPIDTGIEMGILPFDKLQLEIGFDLLLPSDDPLLFNAKVGVPEDLFFKGSPSLSAGIFGVGTSSGTTDYNVLHAELQKNLPFGGLISVGGYYGAGSKLLWTGSDGGENRAGFIGAIVSPDININIPGLKKIVAMADVQTGKNIYGAAGVGLGFYFTDTIDVLTGPIFFLDGDLQPGKSSWMWTVQLDVDITLFAPAPAAAPAAQAASASALPPSVH